MNEPEVPTQPAVPLEPVANSAPPPTQAEPFVATLHHMWARLKAHKVVQWTLAYLAIAYTLLHGAEMLGGTLNWSHGLLRIFTLILILGVPVIITLAWYHGARGQQRVSGTEVMIIALLLALGGAFLWRDSTDHERGAQSADVEPVSTTVPSVVADTRPSIAVLPFENRSREADDAYFVDGVHDEILTQLSKVSALRVISRTSVEQFRDTKLSLKAIADQLGVTKILEGGVQRAGGTVRIHVQLIDAGSDAHLWAERYDRELTAANVFAIQSEIANSIAGALKTSLNAGERTRLDTIPTRNLQAWQGYQLGKKGLVSRNSAGLAEAERHFRKAVELDAAFALAWSGLADALALQIDYAGRPREVSLSEAELAAARALELDGNLAEAWASGGNIAAYRFQYERAEQMLNRAIALSPNYATAYHWLATTLNEVGRWDEALFAIERAIALDPLSPVINIHRGIALRNVGRYDDAMVAFTQSIAIDSTLSGAYLNIGDVLSVAFGHLGEAAPWYEKAAAIDADSPDNIARLVDVYWQLGDDARADDWLSRLLTMNGQTPASKQIASILLLERGDVASSRKYAQEMSEMEPRALLLARDHDLRVRDFSAARARYVKAFPELFENEIPALGRSAGAAIDLALVLQHTGEQERATVLLDRGDAFIQTRPWGTYGIADVLIQALRGNKSLALAKLREAERAGWRDFWRYYRDHDPSLASIRDEPEFKAIFDDIERDIAAQRTQLAARSKDAPLVISAASK